MIWLGNLKNELSSSRQSYEARMDMITREVSDLSDSKMDKNIWLCILFN